MYVPVRGGKREKEGETERAPDQLTTSGTSPTTVSSLNTSGRAQDDNLVFNSNSTSEQHTRCAYPVPAQHQANANRPQLRRTREGASPTLYPIREGLTFDSS